MNHYITYNSRFDKIGISCPQEYTKYWRCLDMNDHMRLRCRDEEIVFNDCVSEKLASYFVNII
jgi:hypothetical protein